MYQYEAQFYALDERALDLQNTNARISATVQLQ
jgi:hypothetical protein